MWPQMALKLSSVAWIPKILLLYVGALTDLVNAKI